MKIDLKSFVLPPDGIAVVTAPMERWGAICEAFQKMDVPERLRGTPVLLLEPGEKISSLSAEELAVAGLKRV